MQSGPGEIPVGVEKIERSDMKKKIIITVLVILALILAFAYDLLGIRFILIRATMDADLPMWLKLMLWGW